MATIYGNTLNPNPPGQATTPTGYTGYTGAPTPAAPKTESMAQFGANYLQQAATDASQQAQQAQSIYNPLLQQYLTGLNQNPLVNLYQTGGTSNPLLQAYMQAAGIPTTAVPQNQPGSPAGQPGGPAQYRGALPATGGPAYTGQTGTQATIGAPQTGTPAAPNTTSITQQALSADNPYGLTQAQQTQLNGQIQQYQMQAQSSVQQYQSQMTADGVDPQHAAEGAALINQTYNQMSDQLAASFAQKAQEAKLAAEANLISGGQAAFGANQNELSGILGSLNQQQQFGTNTALNAGTAALNQANVQAQQAAQANAQNNSFLGSILGAIPGIGSLFSGGGGAAAGLSGADALAMFGL